jgi:hypothetical protein
MKLKISVAAMAVALATICSPCSAQVTYDFTDFGAFIVDPSSGTGLLPTGSLVELGYFNPLTFNFGATQNDFASISAAFQFIGGVLTIPGNPTLGTPIFAGSSSPFIAPAGFDGTQLYLWIFNQPTANASASWTIVTNSTWLLNNASTLSPVSIDLSDIGTVVAGSALNGFARGSIINPSTHGSPGGFDVAVGVPEPSTYFLGMVGGFALLGAMRLRRARAVS